MESETAIQVQSTQSTQSTLTIRELAEQSQLITSAVQSVMKEGEHYGVIPGTRGKPSLLKAGAEKLSLLFRLSASYQIEKTTEGNQEFSYRMKCTLTHIPTGDIIAEGLGYCSSNERKYRKSEAVDVANTVLKMACKRAHVAAVLSGTAASDFFTQDIEDMPRENGKASSPSMATVNQIKTFHTLRRGLDWSDDQAKQWLFEMAGVTTTREVPSSKMSDMIAWLVDADRKRATQETQPPAVDADGVVQEPEPPEPPVAPVEEPAEEPPEPPQTEPSGPLADKPDFTGFIPERFKMGEPEQEREPGEEG